MKNQGQAQNTKLGVSCKLSQGYLQFTIQDAMMHPFGPQWNMVIHFQANLTLNASLLSMTYVVNLFASTLTLFCMQHKLVLNAMYMQFTFKHVWHLSCIQCNT